MASWAIYRLCPWIQPVTAFVAALPPQARVLDLGSSVGARVKRILEVRPDLQITAGDLEDFSALYPPVVKFRQFDATKRFPFADAEFDAVISTHLFEHLPPSTIAGVANEIERIVKPGGRVYIESPGVRSLFYPSIRIGQSSAGMSAGPSNFYDDITHIQPFTLQRLYKLFAGRKFCQVQTGIHRNKLFLAASPVLLLVGLLLRRRIMIVTALYHIGGWAVYVTATRRNPA
ncbi:MAG: class I SAM-dependent methyltransferase [Verrucomicrobiota bacterium]